MASRQECPSKTEPKSSENGNIPSLTGGRGGGRGGRGGRGSGGRFSGGRGDGLQKPKMERGGQMGEERRGGDDRRGMRGGRQMGGGPRNGEGGGRNQDDRMLERLSAINGSTFELPPLDTSEKKFAARNRLYIGNLPSDINEQDINELFKPYGDTSELFINKEKNFGFIRLDFHENAEKAKRELDGTVRKGRTLKIRFAPNGATIKVKNLTTWVSNELLYAAFSVFGEIERCVIIVDERGKSTGEGIVEFARKPGATSALRHCSEGCFFLTASLRPVIAEMYEQMEMIDGCPEKTLLKKSPEFHKNREVGPRFASLGSFEHEYGTRWKQLHELYKQKESSLKQELAMEEDKLEAQMQYAKFENETEMLREQLRVREMDRERQKREWEERERMAEETRVRNEEQMRLHQEEMQLRMHHQEEDLRRRQQENNLFMQAHQLTNILDQQEQVMKTYSSPNDNQRTDYDSQGAAEQPNPMDPKSFMNSYERSHRYEGRSGGIGEMGSSGPQRGGNMGGRNHWGNDNRREDYQNKRRRL